MPLFIEPRPLLSPRGHMVFGGALVLILALSLRIYGVLHTDIIQRDGVTFIRLARQFQESPRAAIDAFQQAPGYPALIVGVHKLLSALHLINPSAVDGWELSGQSISVVMGTLATMGVWILAGLSVGWRVAWPAAAVFAVGRKWTMLGADVMSDATALCFFTFSLLCFIQAVKTIRSYWYAVPLGLCAGALAGAAYLVRPEGLGAFIVGTLLLGIFIVLRRMPWQRGVAVFVPALIAVALVTTPYMMVIGGITKKKHGALGFLAPPPGSVLTLASATPFSGPASDRAGYRALMDQTIEAMHPVLFGFLVIWVVAVILHFLIPSRWRTPYLALPKGPAGLVLLLVPLLYMPLALALHHQAGYLDWRHCMPIAFALVPLGGAGLAFVTDALAHIASPIRIKKLDVPQFVAMQWAWVIPLVLIPLGVHAMGPLHGGKTYIRVAADKLRKSAEPTAYTVTNLSYILHYSQLPGQYVPHTLVDPAQIAAYIETCSPRPDWLVISERWLADHHSPVDAAFPAPHYELIKPPIPYKPADGGDSDLVRIYRIHWPTPQVNPTP